MGGLVCPPWKTNRALASKLQRARRLKAKGLAPVPKSKAAQRALAATVKTTGALSAKPQD